MNEWQWRKEPLDTDAPDLLFLRSLLTLKILARHQTVVVHVWTLLILPLINSSCLRVLVRVVRYALLSFPVEETSFPWTPETSNAIVSSSLLSRSLPDFFTLHLLLCNNRSPSLFWSNCPSSLSFESQGERSLFFMIKMRLQGERRPSMNSWQATHEQEPQNLNTHSQFIRLFWVADFVRKVWLSRLGGEEPLTEKSCPPRTPLPGSHFMLKVGHGSRLRCYQAFNAKPQIHATFFCKTCQCPLLVTPNFCVLTSFHDDLTNNISSATAILFGWEWRRCPEEVPTCYWNDHPNCSTDCRVFQESPWIRHPLERGSNHPP